jgi:hypothetical protein
MAELFLWMADVILQLDMYVQCLPKFSTGNVFVEGKSTVTARQVHFNSHPPTSTGTLSTDPNPWTIVFQTTT